MILVAVSAGALAGAASIGHCALMCGPLALLAGRTRSAAALYYVSRALAYTVAGALAGALGATLTRSVEARWLGALVSWSLAAAALLWARRLWREAGDAPKLTPLHRDRARATRARSWTSRLPRHPALIGAATALLPCGALYAALVLSATSGGVGAGALTMLAFAVTSAVGLWLLSLASATWVRTMSLRKRPGLSRLLAVVLLVGAGILIVRPLDALDGEPATCHVDRADAQ